MYPRAFDYVAPRSKEEALDVLAERGDEVKVLAGGQSLIPMMKLRLASPSTLVDINNIPELNSIDLRNGHLRVQALARHADLVASDLVKAENAAMASCAPWVSDPIVRNRGTLCGSVAHNDPEGDWASVMLACDAEVIVESRDQGERTIHITDCLIDMFTTSIAPTELLTEVRVPRYTTGGGNYQKLERKVGDYATVGVATHLELDDSGKISKAGIGLTSVYAYNLKAMAAEVLLVGETPSKELFAEAARAAAEACDPVSDVRGSAEYKRDVVRVFTERGLAASLAIAQGS
ncbi:MAG: xanthine dehydrogenase family protein subunit M [Actinobacteria bacterium]|nr:MAG: xanthine dehydrogenase family protein subunit M [Actinomycetota bacterium]